MTNAYVSVQWNKHKKVYDLWIFGGCVLFVIVFVAGASVLRPHANLGPEVLVLRGLGALAFSLLHLILIMGPLARLSDRFAPLLYNRRHLGVATCLVGLLHAFLSLGYYGGFGVRNPFVALYGDGASGPLFGLPFEAWGLFGLLTLLVMAATSHDFWLKNLGPRVWKGLHMLIYPAYLSLVLHVGLGAVRAEASPLLGWFVIGGVALVGGLHLTAAFSQRGRESEQTRAAQDGWLDVGPPESIPEDRALIVRPVEGRGIAVFRWDGRIAALTNRCAHQGGPLGEGKVINGCVTCPWHGYQYLPDKGQSPPPFSEKIATHPVRMREGRIEVQVAALAPGTPTEAVELEV